MTIKVLLASLLLITTTSCGLGLNDETNPEFIRAMAPDKFGLSTRFDDDYKHQGYNLGLTWDID